MCATITALRWMSSELGQTLLTMPLAVGLRLDEAVGHSADELESGQRIDGVVHLSSSGCTPE